MEDSFFCQWFKGFEKGLDEMDSHSRSCLLRHCAKHCADTGVLQAYLDLYQSADGDRDTFYSRLSETGDVRGEVVVSNREYRICFPKCACDIHVIYGVNTVHLCECSRQSIMYVAQSVWPDSRIRVEQEKTILFGDSECRFKVIFD